MSGNCTNVTLRVRSDLLESEGRLTAMIANGCRYGHKSKRREGEYVEGRRGIEHVITGLSHHATSSAERACKGSVPTGTQPPRATGSHTVCSPYHHE